MVRYLNKAKNISKPVKAAFWFTICNFILKGISFISVFVFTRLISTDEYGKLSIYNTYESIALILATWEIYLGAYTRGIFKFKEDSSLFTTSMHSLCNILSLVFYLFIFIFHRYICDFTGFSLMLLMLMLVDSLFKPAYYGWMTRKRIDYDYLPVVIMTIMYSIAVIIVPIIAVLFFGRTADIKYGATLSVSALICFPLWIKNANFSELKKNKEKTNAFWKFMIFYEAPLILHSLSYLILSQADRIMISKMIDNKQAAFYSVAYNIAIVVTLLQSSLEQVLGPWRYHQLEDKNYNIVESISSTVLFLYGCFVLIFILIAPDVIRAFFPVSYHEGIWCIPPIAAGAFFMFLYSTFVGIETYYEKTRYVLYVSVSCGALNILLNYFGIQLFGYIACAYTTLISYVLFAIGHYFFMKRTLSSANVSENVVNAKQLFIISTGVIVGSVVLTLLYDYYIIRYAILVLALLAVSVYRNKLISIYKSLKHRSD